MQPINNDNQGKWISLAALVGLVSLMSLNSISLAQNNQQAQQQTEGQELATTVWNQLAFY
jgi:CHASE1-domain containing sensor protein